MKKSGIASKKLNSEPVHNKKHLKAKIISYTGKTNTQNVLDVILINSVYRDDKNINPHMFLEKYENVVKEFSSDEKILMKTS